METRYKKSWYDKRIKQNRIIKTHLIDIIQKHKELELNWTEDDLFCLNYEDLFEIAVASVNKNCDIVLGTGQDWSCGRDGKVSIARFNSYGKHYTAGIPGCKNKKHILALVYEGMQEKFYYFNFPSYRTEHSIPFDVQTGEPKRYTRDGQNWMWNFEHNSFEEMVNGC